MSTAHEHARLAMKAAVKALEGETAPTLEDFKTARDLAKSAHETLKAGCDLLSKGINQVMEEDDQPTPDDSTPLFQEDGQPVPRADLTVPTIGCVPYPDAMDVEVVNHATELRDLLDAWEQFGIEEGRSMKVFIPIWALWVEALEADADEALDLLKWAMENTANCWCDPKCARDLRLPVEPPPAKDGEEVPNA